MTITELILLSLGLAMDAFSVSVCKGLSMKKIDYRGAVVTALFFGVFQGGMPLIGYFLGSRFEAFISRYSHWVAFTLLGFIGGKMIWDSFKEENESSLNPQDWFTGILLAVATSIDALAVGITYACTGYDSLQSLSFPLVIIGLVSFAFSVTGYLLGVRFGEKVNEKVRPELLGGLILLFIGLRILAEHLGLIS